AHRKRQQARIGHQPQDAPGLWRDHLTSAGSASRPGFREDRRVVGRSAEERRLRNPPRNACARTLVFLLPWPWLALLSRTRFRQPLSEGGARAVPVARRLCER